MSHRKVPESFIDDALEKFRLHDLEKGRLVENAGKAILMRNNSNSRIVPPAITAVMNLSERRGSQVCSQCVARLWPAPALSDILSSRALLFVSSHLTVRSASLLQDSSGGGSDLGSAENISHNPGLAPAGSSAASSTPSEPAEPGCLPVPTIALPSIALSGSVETLVPAPAPTLPAPDSAAADEGDDVPSLIPAEDGQSGQGQEVVPKSSSAEEGWGKQK